MAVGAAAGAPLVLLATMFVILVSLGNSLGSPAALQPDAPVLEAWDRMDLGVGVVTIRQVPNQWTTPQLGTGLVLTSSGSILTAEHLVRGATLIEVTPASGGRSYAADVVGTDRRSDLAVIQLRDAWGLPTAPLGSSASLEVGDPVIGVGNAGDGTGSLRRTPGVVLDTRTSSKLERAQPGEGSFHNELLISAPLQPGQSGGPLYDAAGRVVGIDVGAVVDTGGPVRQGGLAVPIETALRTVERINAGEGGDGITIGVPTSIGIKVEDGPDGPRVVFLETGTSAVELGIHETNVVLAIDGVEVEDRDAFVDAVQAHEPGDAVAVTWRDSAGEVRTGMATAFAGPAD